VSDQLTGLVWLKNAACIAPANWASAVTDANQLATGQCGLSDGSSAGEWRLPNLIELDSLIDAAASAPAVSPTNVSNPKKAARLFQAAPPRHNTRVRASYTE
jgi:Protein of unknown function (DUF1566)